MTTRTGRYNGLHGLAAVLLLAPAIAAAQSGVSILYHEPFVIAGYASAPDGATEHLTFDAFGRRFEVLVDDSTFDGPATERIKGRLAGAPRSWVRLSLHDGAFAGVIRDTLDTYIIETRTALSEYQVMTADDSGSPSIIYRLADTVLPPGLLSCATPEHPGPVNGRTAMAELTAELQAATDDEAELLPVTVGVVVDYSMFERRGADTERIVDDLFMTVDAIYSEQVGIRIDPVSLTIAETPAEDVVGDTRVGGDLLDELGIWRLNHQRHFALTHLLTDRSLMNDSRNIIAGISYLGSPGVAGVCDGRTGASISEWLGSGLTALVAAHEIGHSFGAPHDGEASKDPRKPNPCESVPALQHLMSPTLRSLDDNQFSQCSIAQMEKVIAAATCLRPAPSTENAGVGSDSAAAPSSGGSAISWLTLCLLIPAAAVRRRQPRRPTRH